MQVTLYCSAGQLTQDESLFSYENGTSAETFSSPAHEPVFLDELLSSLTDEQLRSAQQTCGDDQFCLFDLLETKNQALAENSLQTNLQNTEEKVVAGLQRKLREGHFPDKLTYLKTALAISSSTCFANCGV